MQHDLTPERKSIILLVQATKKGRQKISKENKSMQQQGVWVGYLSRQGKVEVKRYTNLFQLERMDHDKEMQNRTGIINAVSREHARHKAIQELGICQNQMP